MLQLTHMTAPLIEEFRIRVPVCIFGIPLRVTTMLIVACGFVFNFRSQPLISTTFLRRHPRSVPTLMTSFGVPSYYWLVLFGVLAWLAMAYGSATELWGCSG
jgi:hypothetical protein